MQEASFCIALTDKLCMKRDLYCSLGLFYAGSEFLYSSHGFVYEGIEFLYSSHVIGLCRKRVFVQLYWMQKAAYCTELTDTFVQEVNFRISLTNHFMQGASFCTALTASHCFKLSLNPLLASHSQR